MNSPLAALSQLGLQDQSWRLTEALRLIGTAAHGPVSGPEQLLLVGDPHGPSSMWLDVWMRLSPAADLGKPCWGPEEQIARGAGASREDGG